MAALTDLNITGWPDSTQVVPEDLHPYWCFRDELKILDRLVMKENRVVIPSCMEPQIACMAHIRVSSQQSNVQDAPCINWPKLQDDIIEIVQTCRDYQRYGNKKSRILERQISATRPMKTLPHGFSGPPGPARPGYSPLLLWFSSP